MPNSQLQTLNSPPLLSIITVNFNNCEGLIKTMESVINQTWQQFEYIVIDGGSTDGSKYEIEKRTQNIDYWVSELDGGIYQGMNKGINKSTGKYLLFLNSGDLLISSDSLNNLDKLLHEEFDVLLFHTQRNHSTIGFTSVIQLQDLRFQNIPHNSTFIKRILFEQFGMYNIKYSIRADADWFLKLWKNQNVIQHVDSRVLVYMQEGGVSNSNNFKSWMELVKLRWKYFRDWKFPFWLIKQKLLK